MKLCMMCDTNESSDSILIDVDNIAIKVYLCDECLEKYTLKTLKTQTKDKILDAIEVLKKFDYKVIHKSDNTQKVKENKDMPLNIEYDTEDPAESVTPTISHKVLDSSDLALDRMKNEKNVRKPKKPTQKSAPQEIKILEPNDVEIVKIDPDRSAMAQLDGLAKKGDKLNINVVKSDVEKPPIDNDKNPRRYSKTADMINNKFQNSDNSEINNYGKSGGKCPQCQGTGVINVKNKSYKCPNPDCIDGVII